MNPIIEKIFQIKISLEELEVKTVNNQKNQLKTSKIVKNQELSNYVMSGRR